MGPLSVGIIDSTLASQWLPEHTHTHTHTHTQKFIIAVQLHNITTKLHSGPLMQALHNENVNVMPLSVRTCTPKLLYASYYPNHCKREK